MPGWSVIPLPMMVWRMGKLVATGEDIKGFAGCAPVALFVYNRPDHARLTIDALRANHFAGDTPLYIFSDAAADEASIEAVRQVRELIASIAGFASVTIVRRELNFGLANSIINGVGMLCNSYGRVIVLEDDLITSPYFLQYMNDALRIYEGDETVASVSAYMYPVKGTRSIGDAVFLEFPMSWGWATWRRAWALFDTDGRRLLEQLKSRGLLASFNRVGPGSFVRMLQAQINGRNNSWFIRWHASLYLAGRRSLAPTRSLINNIGLDGTGVHCSQWLFDPFRVEPSQTAIRITAIPDTVDATFKAALQSFFRKTRMLRYANAIHRLMSKVLMRFGINLGRFNGR